MAMHETDQSHIVIKAHDLIAAGYRDGMQFKTMLGAVLEAQRQGLVTGKTDALKFLRAQFGEPPRSFSTLTRLLQRASKPN